MIGKIQVTVETQGNQTQTTFGDFLEKGGYQGNAQDLANSIEEKVTKEQGKGLSSNDFTNKLKEKLENLQNADLSQYLEKGGFSGTAQDLKTEINNILTLLQSNDTDLDTLQEIVDYIKQNKPILSVLSIENIAGLETALAQKVDKNHHHDTLYHRKGEITTLLSKKVDKQEGKGLSSNDFTSEEKQKIQNNANKVVTNASITGDVNKTLTLTFADSTTLQASFVDNQGGGSSSADVMLNSLNFDPQTGILKGVRSDGQVLSVNLDGRYSQNTSDAESGGKYRLVQMDRNYVTIAKDGDVFFSNGFDFSQLPIFDNLRSKPQPLIAQGDYLDAPLLIAPAPFSSLVMRDGGIFNDFGALKMISNGQPKEFVFKEDLDYLIEQKIRQMQNGG